MARSKSPAASRGSLTAFAWLGTLPPLSMISAHTTRVIKHDQYSRDVKTRFTRLAPSLEVSAQAPVTSSKNKQTLKTSGAALSSTRKQKSSKKRAVNKKISDRKKQGKDRIFLDPHRNSLPEHCYWETNQDGQTYPVCVISAAEDSLGSSKTVGEPQGRLIGPGCYAKK